MSCCCQPETYDAVFSEKRAQKDLKRYRKKGPDKTTRLLIQAIKARGVEGQTLLDIGGGVGVVHHELLAAGADSAVHVDAAAGYVHAAAEEVARRGNSARVTFLCGDFVALATKVPSADIVILDRVICCYSDMHALVTTSLERVRRLYAIAIPRDRRVVKVVAMWINAVFRITRTPFRFYVHSPDQIDQTIRRAGLSPYSMTDTLMWRVALYERSGTTS